MRESDPSPGPTVESEKKRRTDRILAPVPIRVLGNDANGVAFSEDTVTITFNQQGARTSLTHSLLIDDVILILNKRTAIEEEFRVVGAFEQVFGERREWGVEALNKDGQIWGIEFAQKSEELRPTALIQCGGCGRIVQSPLSSIEYDILLSVGLISHHCERCRETTRWRPSEPDVMPELVEASPKARKPGQGGRRAKRIKLAMRIRVRSVWGIVDVAQTRDVSKLGLCFLSTKDFPVGEEIFVILLFAAGSVPVETKGRIVWSNVTTGSRYYGVEYMK